MGITPRKTLTVGEMLSQRFARGLVEKYGRNKNESEIEICETAFLPATRAENKTVPLIWL